MCRFFAVFSDAPVRLSWPLLGTSESLVSQSRVDPRRPQRDGWGVGWYDRSRLHVLKSAGFAAEERDRIRTLMSRRKSRVALAHVRAASNPMKLPRSEIIGRAHSQPF